MTVSDLMEELEKCPDKERDVVIKSEGDILHRIVGVYIDGYFIVEVD